MLVKLYDSKNVPNPLDTSEFDLDSNYVGRPGGSPQPEKEDSVQYYGNNKKLMV